MGVRARTLLLSVYCAYAYIAVFGEAKKINKFESNQRDNVLVKPFD